MFEGLRDAGYLVANPMRSVTKRSKLPETRLDVKRSFTEAEWAHVLQCLAAMPAIDTLLIVSVALFNQPGGGASSF